MAEKYYAKDHEYILVEKDTGTVGISNFAQDQLGDVVFVELPEVGKTFSKGEEACVVESVKAASEVLAPVDCEILEVNSQLEDKPGMVNEDAEGGAWFIKVKISDKSQLSELMSGEDYDKFVADS